MAAAPATCDICKRQTFDIVYVPAGMVVGMLIVCKPCDMAYKAQQAKGR
jgi:hypothetical protein